MTGGYDVDDYTDVDPTYGSVEDLDRLLAAARERGLKVLLDFVPCHTSIEHPWFRQRPEREPKHGQEALPSPSLRRVFQLLQIRYLPG